MAPAFVIAAKDLRQRFRDRSAIVVGFVAPLAIAGLMSFAFRGTENFHMTVGVVDRDHGALATAFASLLRSPELHDILTVRPMERESSAAAQVRSGDVDAAFVVPSGFTQAATGSARTDIGVLTSTDRRISGQVAESLATSFVAQVNADRLSVATAIAAGAPTNRLAELAGRAAKLRLPEQITSRPTGTKPLKTISYYAPAMSIFFVLFAVGFATRSFFSERSEGMLDRIAAAPVRPGEVLLGKVLSVFVYAIASLLTVFVVTSVFFGADWGDPVSVVLLCLAMSLAVVAITALVISIARTPQQAQSLSSVVVFVLAVLGGNFVTISAAPPLMRRLALLTPNGWALRGFVDLTTGGGGLSDVVLPIAAILVFTVVVGAAATLRSRDVVVA